MPEPSFDGATVPSPRRVINSLCLGEQRPQGSCMTDESERAVQAAVDGEMRLLDPEVRASPDRVLELLDPEWTEIGASERQWDVESVLTVTSSGSVSAESPVKVSDMLLGLSEILHQRSPRSPGLLLFPTERGGRWL
ncbi:hypothetical protein ABT063_46710 [Streptomyces sp. NPDC002838]|uniref:hypothetical protein n=1 Tax=Streptomyces sp. NPDC002838 TaxID=3154436 RepID=UPI00332648B8